jgi:hypothetical protein
VPFYIEPVTLNLVRDHHALISTIRRQLGEIAKPVAVCLDTLNRSIQGSESSDEDMTAYVNAADAIRAAFDCAVIIVRHCGVDGTRPRGHTALTGACEAQLAVSRNDSGVVTVTVEHMKDGVEGDTMALRLKPVQVGQDEDGEEITSCIVMPVEADDARVSKKRAKLSDKAELARRALVDLVADEGKPAPAAWKLPGDIKVVPVDAWRKTMKRKGVAGDRRKFWGLKDGLKRKGFVGEQDGQVWIV